VGVWLLLLRIFLIVRYFCLGYIPVHVCDVKRTEVYILVCFCIIEVVDEVNGVLDFVGIWQL
jgi:hypothetical protein